MATYNITDSLNSFVFAVFAHQNFPPRRNIATADKWAKVVAHICNHVRTMQMEELKQWAANVILEESSCIFLPTNYTPCGEGTRRREAMDCGGIEGQALIKLAEIVIGDGEPISKLKWTAWSILFPKTASLSCGYDEGAVEEWELTRRPEGVYSIEFVSTPETAERLWNMFFSGIKFPETEEYQGIKFYESRQWLYLEFWWTVHNLIAHPVSQLVWWASLCGLVKPVAKFGDWLHDWTAPVHEHGTGVAK